MPNTLLTKKCVKWTLALSSGFQEVENSRRQENNRFARLIFYLQNSPRIEKEKFCQIQEENGVTIHMWKTGHTRLFQSCFSSVVLPTTSQWRQSCMCLERADHFPQNQCFNVLLGTKIKLDWRRLWFGNRLRFNKWNSLWEMPVFPNMEHSLW